MNTKIVNGKDNRGADFNPKAAKCYAVGLSDLYDSV